jgi:hypothetical protein
VLNPSKETGLVVNTDSIMYILIFCNQNAGHRNRPLGRPRHRLKDGIRMDLRENGLGGVDWIPLAQDRDRWWAVVSAVMNLWVLAPRN